MPAVHEDWDSLKLPGRYQTLTEMVTRQLREVILSGSIPAGGRLNVGELASRFGVSPMPVREAIRILEAAGLVVTEPHRGAVVAAVTREDLAELYEIRVNLEGLAAGLAAVRISEDVVEKLSGLVHQMDRTTDASEWLSLNNDFHTLLYAASGRPRLCALIETLRRNVERALRVYVGTMGRAKQANREHRQILGAVKARDRRKARAALQNHLRSTCRALLRHFAAETARSPQTPVRGSGAGAS